MFIQPGSSSSRAGWIGYQISFLMCPTPDEVARPPLFCLTGQGSFLRITFIKTAFEPKRGCPFAGRRRSSYFWGMGAFCHHLCNSLEYMRYPLKKNSQEPLKEKKSVDPVEVSQQRSTENTTRYSHVTTAFLKRHQASTNMSAVNTTSPRYDMRMSAGVYW